MGAFMLRRARMRGLQEGLVQKARIEATDDDAKDDAERFQDYGFSANPVDGQGLVLNIGGHTIILRKDRLADRPQLGDYEVTVWHKEGHRVTLKAGKLVQVDCDHFVLNAAQDVTINTQTMTVAASTKIVNQTPLDQVTGVHQPQELTIGGISGPGSASMAGGSWTMNNVAWTVNAGTTVYAGGTLTFNGHDLSDTHTHKNVTVGAGVSGTVS